jgi:hypothetical protein
MNPKIFGATAKNIAKNINAGSKKLRETWQKIKKKNR